jgi:hypothetical protein
MTVSVGYAAIPVSPLWRMSPLITFHGSETFFQSLSESVSLIVNVD